MSTLAEMKVDGKSKSVFPNKFSIGSFRVVAPLDGSVGLMQGATATFEIDLEEETDSDSFFATWYMEGKKKDVSVDITQTGETSKFLTIECLDAQITSYNALIDQNVKDVDNSLVAIAISCLSITVGQGALTNGF
jgi:hypothetical protein